jgi:hypothetical protein
MKSKSKAPGTERLKLDYDNPLSNFAFSFNLRRYTVDSFYEYLLKSYILFGDQEQRAIFDSAYLAGAYNRPLFSLI